MSVRSRLRLQSRIRQQKRQGDGRGVLRKTVRPFCITRKVDSSPSISPGGSPPTMRMFACLPGDMEPRRSSTPSHSAGWMLAPLMISASLTPQSFGRRPRASPHRGSPCYGRPEGPYTVPPGESNGGSSGTVRHSTPSPAVLGGERVSGGDEMPRSPYSCPNHPRRQRPVRVSSTAAPTSIGLPPTLPRWRPNQPGTFCRY